MLELSVGTGDGEGGSVAGGHRVADKRVESCLLDISGRGGVEVFPVIPRVGTRRMPRDGGIVTGGLRRDGEYRSGELSDATSCSGPRVV